MIGEGLRRPMQARTLRHDGGDLRDPARRETASGNRGRSRCQLIFFP
jgi:hypothetical protein